MRVIIEIVEGAYIACKAVKDVEDDGRNPLLSYLINAVANGTPLDDIKNYLNEDTNLYRLYDAINIIEAYRKGAIRNEQRKEDTGI